MPLIAHRTRVSIPACLFALILTVLTALLTVLGLPEATRQIVFGAIIVAVAAAYTRVTSDA